MKRRKLFVTLGALGALLLFSIGLTQLFVSMKPEKETKPVTNNTRFVKIQSVSYDSNSAQVSGRGRVASISNVSIVSEASGKIERGSVTLKKGASFKKGQLLFSIYKDEAALMLKASKSSFLTTMANIMPDLKIDFPEQYAQFDAFYQAISLNKELPKLPLAVIENKETLKTFLATRNVLNQYYSVKQSELQLKRYNVYAPFNGSFTMVNAEVGAYVNMGAQVATAIQTNALEIEVPIVNVQSKWIKNGQQAQVVLDNGLTEQARVIRKSGFVDPQTQMRTIYVKLQRNDAALVAGEYVEVSFSGYAVDNVMEVPRSAIFNSNDMFVVVNNRLQIREVSIVKLNDKTALIRGLEQGTELVVEPLANVKENTVVKTIQ